MPLRHVTVTSKAAIETYLRRNVFLHLYEIGDLDDFFWPHTSWFTLEATDDAFDGPTTDDDGLAHLQRPNSDSDTSLPLNCLAMVYSSCEPHVLLCLENETSASFPLLKELASAMPSRFYSHLSRGLDEVLKQCGYSKESHGMYYKMALQEWETARTIDTSNTIQLTPKDLQEALTFYATHYPGNWFDARMLETGQTFGIRCSTTGEFLAIAGIHVFSIEYKVASLGNIATHSLHRGKGLAQRVTAALINSLVDSGIHHIGLNVLSTNNAALAAYKKLGFAVIAEFDEIMWNRNASSGATSDSESNSDESQPLAKSEELFTVELVKYSGEPSCTPEPLTYTISNVTAAWTVADMLRAMADQHGIRDVLQLTFRSYDMFKPPADSAFAIPADMDPLLATLCSHWKLHLLRDAIVFVDRASAIHSAQMRAAHREEKRQALLDGMPGLEEDIVTITSNVRIVNPVSGMGVSENRIFPALKRLVLRDPDGERLLGLLAKAVSLIEECRPGSPEFESACTTLYFVHMGRTYTRWQDDVMAVLPVLNMEEGQEVEYERRYNELMNRVPQEVWDRSYRYAFGCIMQTSTLGDILGR